MSRRNILVYSYHFPTGEKAAKVTLEWTLVDAATHKKTDGYRSEDNKGVVGTYTVVVNGDEHSVPLTPTTELLGETEWRLVIRNNDGKLRTVYTTLAAGADLTLPEFIALDPAPGYWDIVENRLLPNPAGSVDGSIPTIVSEEWVVGDAPAGLGTVTSVAVTGADGITVSGSPITGAGTIALGLDPGSIPAGETGPSGTDGLGWTGASYADATGVVTFTSDDGLGFSTGDLRGADGADGATGPAGPSDVSTDAGQVLSLGTDSLIYYDGGTGGHDPLTVTDGATVNLTLTGQDLTAEVIPGAIDATGLLNGPAEENATADQTAQEIATAIDDDATAETTLKSALGLGTAAYTATGDYDPAGTATGAVGTHESTYAHADIATAVQEGDSRLTDARTPTSHAASHATGQTDALTPAAIGAVATGDMPTAMSQAVAETGTSTTPQLISADVLKAGVLAVRPLVDVVTASGSLTVADHNARWVVTSGNVVVPHASGSKGFYCEIQAGGAHTVTFNSTASAAMAVGDIMTVYVTDDADGTPTIKAVLTEAANLVTFA